MWIFLAIMEIFSEQENNKVVEIAYYREQHTCHLQLNFRKTWVYKTRLTCFSLEFFKRNDFKQFPHRNMRLNWLWYNKIFFGYKPVQSVIN